MVSGESYWVASLNTQLPVANEDAVVIDDIVLGLANQVHSPRLPEKWGLACSPLLWGSDRYSILTIAGAILRNVAFFNSYPSSWRGVQGKCESAVIFLGELTLRHL